MGRRFAQMDAERRNRDELRDIKTLEGFYKKWLRRSESDVESRVIDSETGDGRERNGD